MPGLFLSVFAQITSDFVQGYRMNPEGCFEIE